MTVPVPPTQGRPGKSAGLPKPDRLHEAALICRVAGVNPMASEGERK